MKRFSVVLCMVCVLPLIAAGAAAADVSKAEKNLDREVKRLNDTAAKPDGEKAVVKRLNDEYQATDANVQMLRAGKLGYGEIAVVFSLAGTMPGGATDANVRKVFALRQGPPVLGWGEVARQLGTKLGRTVSQVRKTANNANREIKTDHARAGKAPKSAAPPEQTNPQQGTKHPDYKGEGRLLPHGSRAN